jgi:hypothetical protein
LGRIQQQVYDGLWGARVRDHLKIS